LSIIKIDGFKMFEKAPYEKADPRAILELVMRGAKDVEKVYGLVFTTNVIKYALRAVASQTREDPPLNIQTLDQLTEFLISKSDRLLAPPYYIAFWAQYVTEKKLEGSLGAGYQVSKRGFAKGVMESDGDLRTLGFDVDKVLSKLRKLAVEMNVAPLEFGYKKNEDGSVDIAHGGCPYLEGCRSSAEQALLQRPDGRISCGSSVFVCQFLKTATGCEWDHTVLEFIKPHCVTRVFMIQ
jgi:hypothetical protein